ncbi:hypothetical protein LTR36_007797 [Oleoguttula mirabilis]|uniref:Uncharacterized protein n=1 Tax=Oleoguttula mirabilis TaxID=1507867 RepID=A0AAV9J967_9PEZI|nr:hypothetical protein LTR36_007797 [Oleoguttula mirabilis]
MPSHYSSSRLRAELAGYDPGYNRPSTSYQPNIRPMSPRGSRYDEPEYAPPSTSYSTSRRPSVFSPDRYEARQPTYTEPRRESSHRRPSANEFTGDGCGIGRRAAVRRDDQSRYRPVRADLDTFGGDSYGRMTERPTHRWPLQEDTESTRSSRRGTDDSSYHIFHQNSGRSVNDVPDRHHAERHSSNPRLRPGNSLSAVYESAGTGGYGSYRRDGDYGSQYELPRRSDSHRSHRSSSRYGGYY